MGDHHDDILRAHGYHALTVTRVVEETDDARSYVLDVPDDLAETFRYRPGQFCTFRVHVGEDEHLRSYSMCSAPETDTDLTVTVKRVPGGIVSNWFLDHVSAGDTLEVTRPAGVFCLHDRDVPIVAFCGGSGITPVMSIAKSALASTRRPVKLVYANRSRASVIFERSLHQMCRGQPDRIAVHHHVDSESGLLDADAVAGLAAGSPDGDFYICGPGPFMDLVETTLLGMGVAPSRIAIERFVSGRAGPPTVTATPDPGTERPETVNIIMGGKKTAVAYQPGDTLLETARRAALRPPYSCESGSCATCMAILRHGSVTMRVNDALTPEEVDEGWILTCQAIPVGPAITVEYETI